MFIKKFLSKENIHKKLGILLKELQEKTGASDEELDELKKILDIADFFQDQE
tara:strand:- start:454 stop:609 length:156 start_codon:yes stop_codon:yes gene_type:complete